MRKLLLLPFFTSFLFTATAQTIENNNLVIGKVDSIHSRILNENRKIWVYLPSSASDKNYQKQHFPILYLLDAESHFTSVTAMIQQLSEVNGNTVIPQMIVIGIPNEDRTRDLTPTKALKGPEGKAYKMFDKSGGGEKFAAFIEQELMPHMDSLYAPAAHKTIIGHSFGGLTVMNLLVHHPQLFNHYIAIDPSMWWDSRKLLKETTAALGTNKVAGKSLFVGIANTMTTEMDTADVVSDTSGTTEHLRAILLLDKAVKNQSSSGLKYASKYYKDDSHGSVPLIAEYDALRIFYKDYGLTNAQVTELYKPESKVKVDKWLMERYKEMSQKLGYTIMPPEPFVNRAGNYFLSAKQAEKAFALFSLNLQNYPESFSAQQSMGSYYESTGDKKKAIIYYTKALAIQDNPDTMSKLKSLQKRQ